MLHNSEPPSEARRLTDVMRAGSDRSEVFGERGPIEERAGTLQMVLEGGVLRQRFLSDGRRQTVSVYYRDDVINIASFVGSRSCPADYLVALKGAVIGYVADVALRQMRADAPTGQDGMASLASRELNIALERLTCLGQRSAIERMAHFLCETLVRCSEPLRDHKTDRCSLHMTQELLSSVLGLSSVHVNRTMQELRRLKLADLVRNELIVHDFDGLAHLGEFDEGYLASI